MSISLDGYMEGPNKEIDWHLVDAELHQHFNDELRNMGAFIDGRVTHELMASFWPTADKDPASSPQMAEFAGIWREMPKIVYSRTLTDTAWNTTIKREVDAEDILAMKAESGGDLALGGADLTATFLRENLIDEFNIYIHPVLLGGGKPLFQSPIKQMNLRLLNTQTFGNGVVRLHYQVPNSRR